MTSKESFLPEAEIIRSPLLCLSCGVDPSELFSWSVGAVQTIKKGPQRAVVPLILYMAGARKLSKRSRPYSDFRIELK